MTTYSKTPPANDHPYHCHLHGWWSAVKESGCPTCVVEARRCIRQLETELAAANARIAELEHQNAVLRDAHQRANAESLRLAELLNKAAPDWGSPMRLT